MAANFSALLIVRNGYIDVYFLLDLKKLILDVIVYGNLMVSVDWLENSTREVLFLTSQDIFLLEKTLF